MTLATPKPEPLWGPVFMLLGVGVWMLYLLRTGHQPLIDLLRWLWRWLRGVYQTCSGCLERRSRSLRLRSMSVTSMRSARCIWSDSAAIVRVHRRSGSTRSSG